MASDTHSTGPSRLQMCFSSQLYTVAIDILPITSFSVGLSVMSIMKKKKKMEDRISPLPDSLLHHILSSLNTIQVVQTCVLSKRWKTLWIHIPTLNFHWNSQLFKYDPYDVRMRSLEQFIFRVLSEHCCTQIQKLSYVACSVDIVIVELLISYARCRNVRQLCIQSYFDTGAVYDWKYCFSACSSLTVLKIICAFTDNWGALALPSLKILEIECEWNWDFEYDGIEMFSGCPNLESLVLIDFCFWSVSLCAPKLENFELFVSYQWPLAIPNLELLAPNLKTVKFSNILPSVKSALEFSSINTVILEVEDSNFEIFDCPSREEAATNVCELLRLFYNANSLVLPMEIQVGFSLSSLSGISFHNLKHLKLKTKLTNYKVIDLPMTILAYIQKCPNLETLAVLNEKNENRSLRGCYCC